MCREDLMKLYNTLALIETKGENTKIMAQCLQFIEQQLNTPVQPAENTETAA